MSFTAGVDSFYQYVKARILQKNGSRQVKGLLTAQDWPSKPIVFNAFYLLVLGESSIGKQAYSAAVPIKMHTVQWVWIIQGTDLTPGIRQANRGDKYRIMQDMKDELTYGMYPGFTEKFAWALNDGNGIFESTPLDPVEFITWTPVEFHERTDKESGSMYGSASTRITDMLDEITS